METWDAIRARRNVRTYQGKPIPPADLDRVAGAAAAIALVLPEPEDQRMLIVDRYDLGRATYATRWPPAPSPTAVRSAKSSTTAAGKALGLGLVS